MSSSWQVISLKGDQQLQVHLYYNSSACTIVSACIITQWINNESLLHHVKINEQLTNFLITVHIICRLYISISMQPYEFQLKHPYTLNIVCNGLSRLWLLFIIYTQERFKSMTNSPVVHLRRQPEQKISPHTICHLPGVTKQENLILQLHMYLS